MGVNRTNKINRYRNTDRRRQVSRENSPVPGKVLEIKKRSHKRRSHRHQHRRKTPSQQRAQVWATIAQSTHDIVTAGDARYIETRRCKVKLPFANPTGESGTGPSRQAVREEILHIVHHIAPRIADSIGRTQILYDDTELPIDPKTVVANKGRTSVRFTGKSILAAARGFAALKPRDWGTAPRSRVAILTPMPTTQSPSSALDPSSTLARNTSYRATLTSSLGELFLSTVQHSSSGMLYAPDVLGIRRDDGDTLYQSEPDFDPYLHGERLSDDDTQELLQPLAVDNRSHKALGALVAPYAVNVLAFPVSGAAPIGTADSSPLSPSAALVRALEVCAGTGNRTVVFDGSRTDVREAAELLACAAGRFKNVFDQVVFAGLGDASRRKFREAFEMRVLEDELDLALEESSESEDEEEEEMEEVVV
ncbi:hypothetical protein PENSPDRAFT_15407 [Peniophora sp. CONT]|nr:hypothetical protein PENSPDRAFT_15407 [Peniophora sp. CONT]